MGRNVGTRSQSHPDCLLFSNKVRVGPVCEFRHGSTETSLEVVGATQETEQSLSLENNESMHQTKAIELRKLSGRNPITTRHTNTSGFHDNITMNPKYIFGKNWWRQIKEQRGLLLKI